MKSWIVTSLIAVALLSPSDVFSQKVTLSEYLDEVKQRHPFFAAQAMQSDVETLERDRFVGDKDWVLQSSPFINFQEPIIANTFSPERITRLNLNASAERAYWGNGSRLALTARG